MKAATDTTAQRDFIQSANANNQATVESNPVILLASALSARFHAWNRSRIARRDARLCVNRVRDELNNMSDRDLADIGIKRGMIDEIARETHR